MGRLYTAVTTLALACALPLHAAAAPPGQVTNLEELLTRVRQGAGAQAEEAKAREAAFLAEKAKQQARLAEVRAEEQRLLERSAKLERAFDAGERRAAELEELLQKRMGDSGELFGLVRQVAGDTRGQLAASLISAQLPGRDEQLTPLTQSKSLPTLEQLERLWFLLHQELTEAGKVKTFDATVVNADGEKSQARVTRVGAFNLVSGGEYLVYSGEDGSLTRLPRQPASRYLDTASALERAAPGSSVPFAIDPSRGSVLSMLVRTPTLRERIELGGVVGYVILALGALALLLGLLRLVYLTAVRWSVARQAKRVSSPGRHNPLGRVLGVYQTHRQAPAEALERKLDEAIVKESGRMDRLLWVIKVVSVVAPLLGLLGTVTGMIQTFQAITLFGTGDPKLMAGGISEALVTTMLGLVVAIPLLLLHSTLSTLARRIVDVLHEQATGMLAEETEREAAA